MHIQGGQVWELFRGSGLPFMTMAAPFATIGFRLHSAGTLCTQHSASMLLAKLADSGHVR